ncbi:cation:proton antiporter [Actinacidiphila bryophytorum]|uniref:cation:proton antiporter n=1 Tax=Actinacidiphila bryophytorum TaxID=1436133 RepID=UPI002041880F|nr:cation:proton antiporter [Actinacidiphila bryophytorum]
MWATTWESEANEYLAPFLGLPQLPVVSWPDPSEEPEPFTNHPARIHQAGGVRQYGQERYRPQQTGRLAGTSSLMTRAGRRSGQENGMDAALSLILLALFLWGLCSRRVAKAELTGPVVFVLLGLVMHEGIGSVDLAPSPKTVKVLAEITLTWVLFTDAARLSVRSVRADLRLYVRLLAVGLPLCIGLGALLAGALLPGVSGWAALFVGAALAPTDAALGASMMGNPVVPERIRRAINVESGLNDGIATPFVVLSLAGIAALEAGGGHEGHGGALVELLIGVAYGGALGLVAGQLLNWALHRGWATEDFAPAAVLALALLSYTSAIAFGGNGFVAAFVSGLAFGAADAQGAPQWQLAFAEQSASVLSLLVWLLFGAVLLPEAFHHLSWHLVLYAVVSLTLVRMVPVALALLGGGLDRSTVLFVGWFGPRGLASVVFGLLAVEELDPAAAREVVPVVVCTVLLSVVAHGTSSAPLARRYGTRHADAAAQPERGHGQGELPVRGLAKSAGHGV